MGFALAGEYVVGPDIFASGGRGLCFPSLPSGRQLATRPEAVPPPGRLLSRTGVSSGKACGVRNPQPCGLTTRATHSEANMCFRSRLVTVMGISTRTRVLRRVVLGVDTSIWDA